MKGLKLTKGWLVSVGTNRQVNEGDWWCRTQHIRPRVSKTTMDVALRSQSYFYHWSPTTPMIDSLYLFSPLYRRLSLPVPWILFRLTAYIYKRKKPDYKTSRYCFKFHLYLIIETRLKLYNNQIIINKILTLYFIITKNI